MPWLIRAGKNMPVTATEAVVEFNAPPRHASSPSDDRRTRRPNHLRFRLGTDGGIMLHLTPRRPATG